MFKCPYYTKIKERLGLREAGYLKISGSGVSL